MNYIKLSFIISVSAIIFSLSYINIKPHVFNDCSVVNENETSQKVYFAISHGHCNLPFTAVTDYVQVNNFKSDFSSLKIDFGLNTASLVTFDGKGPLTQSLLSPDMFNGDGKNHIKFKTADVFMLGENWIQLRGTLSINGNENTLRLMVTPVFEKDQVISFVIDGEVDLNEYGIGKEEENDEGVIGNKMSMNMVVPVQLKSNCLPGS